MADHQATLRAEDGLGCLEGDQPGEPLVIDHLVAVLFDGEQVRVVRGGQ